MQQRTTRVNASEETIRTGPLEIRFLLTGDDSNGSVSVFEVLVPAGQKAGGAGGGPHFVVEFDSEGTALVAAARSYRYLRSLEF